jgi:hypothetical protein
MKSLILISLRSATLAGNAVAQYVGPDSAPKSIKEMQAKLARQGTPDSFIRPHH